MDTVIQCNALLDSLSSFFFYLFHFTRGLQKGNVVVVVVVIVVVAVADANVDLSISAFSYCRTTTNTWSR